MQSTQNILEKTSRLGNAFIWVDVPIQIGEFGDFVELSRFGNDPEDLLPPYSPRPASGGAFLGFTSADGVTETPDVSFEDIKKAGASAPQRVQITSNKVTVTAQLFFNNVDKVLKYFLIPGASLPMGFTFGGTTEPPYHNLLLIHNNIINPSTSVVKVSLYYKGYFRPSPERHNRKDFSFLELNYTALTGDRVEGSTMCARPAGDQLGRKYWVDVDWATSVNTFVQPNGEPISLTPQTNNTIWMMANQFNGVT
jgi:hypothetical protein